jgi:hypothetical protein
MRIQQLVKKLNKAKRNLMKAHKELDRVHYVLSSVVQKQPQFVKEKKQQHTHEGTQEYDDEYIRKIIKQGGL